MDPFLPFSEIGPCEQIKGQGLEFDMKDYILHDAGTSTPFEKKSSDHFKDFHKLKHLTNFDVNLTSFL